MSSNALMRFILLAAIWGASFLFMRILSQPLGGFWTAELRLAIGGLTLTGLMLIRRMDFDWQYWKHYLIAGFLNCALPFTLFGLAASVLPAAYSAVLNSAVPLWAAALGALLLKDPITPQRLLALCLGLMGVIFVAQPSTEVHMGALFFGGIASCLLASASYALSAIYVKKKATAVKPMALATMSQIAGAVLLLPIVAFIPLHLDQVTPVVALSVLGLGVLCSGVAMALYYGLLNEIGAMATAVTFLIPLFGIFWGWLILHEAIHWNVYVGCALIISGAYLLFRNNIQPTQTSTAK